MKIGALLFTILSLAGVSWADCLANDTPDSEPASSVSHHVLRHTAYRQFRSGHYQKALDCYVEALHTAQARGPENSAEIATDLNDIATLSEEMGRYDEAHKLYAQELEVLKPLGDRAAAAIGETYMEMGGLLLIEGSLGPAEADYKKAITLLTRHAGPENPRTAKAMGGLGRLYAESGRYDEASKLLGAARTIVEKDESRNGSILINILDSEGSLLCSAGKFAEAEKRWLRAMNVAERTYGEDGVQYSALLLHLGQLYTEIHEYQSAEKVLERGLNVEQKIKGADEMDRGIMMSALGNVYLQQRKLARAEPLFEGSLTTLRDHCEALPLACAAVRTSLGDYYMLKSQWQAAKAAYEQALTVRENTLGEHPLVASSLVLLSRALRKLKRKKEANAYVARAVQIMSLPKNAAYAGDNTIDVRSFRATN
ncbi:MAG TPA: tetratricopeptide repeat protein [Bryobacteraceae bacterium]|jgi:tetratricopeptide (TPR) repeat protein|nr:tetratricopeptide repeat protein [Bryobacteraceae bacterium]